MFSFMKTTYIPRSFHYFPPSLLFSFLICSDYHIAPPNYLGILVNFPQWKLNSLKLSIQQADHQEGLVDSASSVDMRNIARHPLGFIIILPI